MTSPGEMVENLGKNCRTAMNRKKMFAIRRNCSSRLRGKNVMIVYLEVMFWLLVNCFVFNGRPFLSK